MHSDFLQNGEPILFIPAKNSGPSRVGVTIDWLVVHTMETPEKPGTAKNVALWFGGRTKALAPSASAHYCVDAAEIIQCVEESVVAWAAPGANRRGIHIEHAGFAAQTPVQWGDAYSLAMLRLSAVLAADVCKRHAIPLVRLSVDDLKSGARGLCGHVDVTNAFNGGKGHTDPGASFPWDLYLQMVREESMPTERRIAMVPPADRQTDRDVKA